VREVSRDPLGDRRCGVALLVQAEDDLEIRIILIAKRGEIFIQARLEAVERFENRDSRRFR
jgi:hypothetical protein